MATDWLEKTRAIITEYGVAVQGVLPEPGSGPFAYSIGLTELDEPEVIIAGLDMHVAQQLINEVHRRVTDSVSLEPGQVFDDLLAGGFQMRVCKVTDEHEANVARANYGEDVRVVQLVFQDKERRFPWEAGYSLDPAVQRDWFVQP